MTDSDNEQAKHGLALRYHPLLITMIALLLLAVVVILVVHWYSMQNDEITHRAYQASELPLLVKSTAKPKQTMAEIAVPLSPLQFFPPGHHPENVRVLYQTASNDGPIPSLGIYAAHAAPSAARLGKHKHELI